MDDKRKFRRFQINLPCLLIKEPVESSPIAVTAVDASFGGVGLLCPEDLPKDTPVTLTWDRPPFALGQKEVTLKGVIVSSRRKPTQPGKFAVSVVYDNHDADMGQKMVHWAQMQSLVQAKARTKAIGQAKLRGSSFY